MKFTIDEYQNKLPLSSTEKWREGVWSVDAFKHGSMSLIYFAPEGNDYQTPHNQDEIYIVIEGSGTLKIEQKSFEFNPGDVLFVPAGKTHQFQGCLQGIKMWAVFYGDEGGEANE